MSSAIKLCNSATAKHSLITVTHRTRKCSSLTIDKGRPNLIEELNVRTRQKLSSRLIMHFTFQQIC